MAWIEIPAHRVWVISAVELLADYEFLDGDGKVCRDGAFYELVRRKSDGRLYRRARTFGGPSGVSVGSFGSSCVVLEES